jgi:hypothetical protein
MTASDEEQRIRSAAASEPNFLFHTIQSAIAGMLVQHGALLLEAQKRFEELVGCGCDECLSNLKQVAVAMSLNEADIARLRAAAELVAQVLRYRKPDDASISEAFDRVKLHTARTKLEKTFNDS